MTEPRIDGHCDPRFAPVREAFARNFEGGGEIGAAVGVVIDGAPVVDLWGGHADPARTRPWHRDTLVHVYSTTKGVTALCAHRLADQGKLDLDARVARYWPEFAAAGKGDATVRDLLAHRACLPAIREMLPPESLYDWKAMTAALAAEAPWWEPGTRLAYHPMTFGWLVGEVVRRASERSLGRYLREEIAGPFEIDFHVGLGDDELARCADITTLEPPDGLDLSAGPGDPERSLAMLAFLNPMGTGDHNSERHRRAEIPAINGHGTARGLARLYGGLAAGGALDGATLLSPGAVAALSHEEASGVEATLGMTARLGPGFQLSDATPGGVRFTADPRGFGHSGAGGSVAFADPGLRLGFAYVCNRLGSHLDIDPRARALIDACIAAL